jgi:beta-glucosidase
MEIYKFPQNFKWGSATSAHQVEGNNYNDWSEWEISPERILKLKKIGKNPKDYISGKACDSYNRFNEDFEIAKKLNQNIHRFSIEWSRIEPKEGSFNERELEHYKTLIESLLEKGIEPMITLWHFTNPVWFSKKGGFLNTDSPKIFTRYVRYIVDNLKDKVKLWITFNEAVSVYSSLSYLLGEWPPQHRNIFKYIKVRENFIKAHILAFREIRKIYNISGLESSGFPNNVAQCRIGLVENNSLNVYGNYWYEKIIGRFYNYQRNLYFLDKAFPYYDFIGLNYYHLDRRMPGSYRVLPKQDWMPEMDWEIYPKGIYYVLTELKKFKKPIFITENGIADGSDKLRSKFIKDHLYWVWRAIQDGVDVYGYIYWSLLDNFEWTRGFKPKFGLVEVNFPNLERKIRTSAYEYAKICLTNQLEIDSLKTDYNF